MRELLASALSISLAHVLALGTKLSSCKKAQATWRVPVSALVESLI